MKGGNRFLVVPTIGLWKALATDSSFVFLMNIVKKLVSYGNYAYVVLPRDIDMSGVEKIPGVMYFSSDIPARALDTQMGTLDSAFISNTFGFQYGKYVVDAGIVLHGSQVIPLKQAVHPRGPIDCFPVFCLEQGVSWIDTAPGYQEGRFDEELMVLGASYSHLISVSTKDQNSYRRKARHFDLSATRYDALCKNGYVGSAPVNLELLQSVAAKEKKNEIVTLLYAARTNKTKHPEEIVAIFDSLYKQNEPCQVTYITQTSELKFSIIAKRRNLFDERQYMNPKTDQGPESFYREAARSHVFVNWSDSESYNASAVEATMLGCVFCSQDAPQHRELYNGDLGGDQFWFRDKSDGIEKLRWIIHNYETAFKMQAGLRARFHEQQTKLEIAAHLDKQARAFHEANVQSVANRLYYYKLAETAELTKIIDGVLANWKEPTIRLVDILAGLEAHGDAFSTDNLYRAISRVMPVNQNLFWMMKHWYQMIDTCKDRYPVFEITDETRKLLGMPLEPK